MPTLRAPALLLLVSTLLAGTHLTCKKKPTEPPNGGPDTTSHNFTFVLDTLGDGSPSVLNDVAIISENNVWAVGEIYRRDSTGQFETQPYNAVRWDGNRWHYVRVPTRIFGTSSFMYAPLKALWAFSPTSIVVTTGGQVIWYDGQSWGRWEFLFTSLNDTTFGGINRFWAKGSNALWGAGNKGNIFFFNGTTWTKLTSGTTVDIQDIYGAVDARTGETEILAVASYRAAIPQAKKLLRITGTAVTAVNDSGLPLNLSGIWFTTGSRYYVVGAGLYHQSRVGDPWQYEQSLPVDFYKDAIRGNAANDIIVSGSSGWLWHYNGASWRAYRNNGAPAIFGRYYRVDIRGDFVAAVGWMDNTAVAVRGRRTH